MKPQVVIQGTVEATGVRFRPTHAWTDMLLGGNTYAGAVTVTMKDDWYEVTVDYLKLLMRHPEALVHILSFASLHGLIIRYYIFEDPS